MEPKIRKKSRRELASQRRPEGRRKCNDWLACAMPWPFHGVNAGTILRSCEATGACFCVPHYPWIPEALRKGYTLAQRADVHWIRPNPLGWLAAQKEKGTRVIGLELADEAIRLHDLKMAQEKTILVLGHEQKGIPDEALDLLDECVEIPMIGTGTTLNVACAATVLLYRLAGLD
jgi:tRNA (guanosine-2'-O-)-methyltransferase